MALGARAVLASPCLPLAGAALADPAAARDAMSTVAMLMTHVRIAARLMPGTCLNRKIDIPSPPHLSAHMNGESAKIIDGT